MTTEVATYRTSSTNLAVYQRKTKDHITGIKAGLIEVLNEQHPMTVRQVFYQMTSRGYIAKTEAEYRQTVCRLLTDLRLDGTIPFGWIADNTRWMRKPDSYSSLSDSLKATLESYRRDIWKDMAHYVEIWIEKDALAGVVGDVTGKWDVPLMVTRGYSSLSYLHGAAQTLIRINKPAYIYYLGDYDPSGLDIARTTESRLRQFAPNLEIHFERIAVTPQQIQIYGLPTRPTKKTDTRSRGFNSDSVELDAIPPQSLRDIVSFHILEHIQASCYGEAQASEYDDKALLNRIVEYVVENEQRTGEIQ